MMFAEKRGQEKDKANAIVRRQSSTNFPRSMSIGTPNKRGSSNLGALLTPVSMTPTTTASATLEHINSSSTTHNNNKPTPLPALHQGASTSVRYSESLPKFSRAGDAHLKPSLSAHMAMRTTETGPVPTPPLVTSKHTATVAVRILSIDLFKFLVSIHTCMLSTSDFVFKFTVRPVLFPAH